MGFIDNASSRASALLRVRGNAQHYVRSMFRRHAAEASQYGYSDNTALRSWRRR
ncbi:hypothetical protein XCR_1761 [Xanthomonas campestris pv. raphani 756C]|nr:hypothetical protein XCR_1761 [Xanthomonas campestris pv. raphani 756C]